MEQHDIDWLSSCFYDIDRKFDSLIEENMKLREDLKNTTKLLESRIFAVGIMDNIVLTGIMLLIFILIRQIFSF